MADRSNEHGFQFEFYCDKCNNGHLSEFSASKLGLAASFQARFCAECGTARGG